jgi:hypothetical protein
MVWADETDIIMILKIDGGHSAWVGSMCKPPPGSHRESLDIPSTVRSQRYSLLSPPRGAT